VAYSSSPPIIHRDIKPQSILVGYEADGLAKKDGVLMDAADLMEEAL